MWDCSLMDRMGNSVTEYHDARTIHPDCPLDELKLVSSTLPNFKIKISDGWVEYEYPLEINREYSVESVYKKICEAFGARICDGKKVSI